MKILYIDTSFCNEATLKRFLLIANEIVFMDRPSLFFGNWGMVGVDTPARHISSEGSPVRLKAFRPPSGPAERLYIPYIERDLQSPEFIYTFLEGLESKTFAQKFLHLESKYGEIHGHEIWDALRKDSSLVKLPINPEVNEHLCYLISSTKERQETLKTLLIEASVRITCSMIVSEKTGAIPVTDDPHFSKLLSLRTSSPSYIGGTSSVAPFVGLAFATAVIPDETLQQLSINDILNYRKKTQGVYQDWSIEINRIASEIESLEGGNLQGQVAKIIAKDLMPQLNKYHKEMEAVRDDLFADLIKKAVKWELPTLSIAYITLGYAGAIVAFISALSLSLPGVVDYYKKRRDVERKNSMSFLIRLTNK